MSFEQLAAMVAFQTTVLLALAWIGHLALGRRRSIERSHLWHCALVGAVCVPVLVLVLPAEWRRRIELPRFLSDANRGETQSPLPEMNEPTEVERAEERFAAAEPHDARVGRAPTKNEEDGRAVAIVPAASPGTRLDVIAPEPRGLRIEWSGWMRPRRIALAAIGVWAVGSVLLLVRLTGSMRDVARLSANSVPIGDSLWQNVLARELARAGIRRNVSLRATQAVDIPVVAGAFSPVIYVPRALAESATEGQIEAVVIHELAHVRRADYAWNLWYRFVRAIYWPQPLLWPVGRAIYRAREHACDDWCVGRVGSRYRDALVDVVSAIQGVRREPAVGLAMGRPSRLAERIHSVEQSPGSSRLVCKPAARSAIVAAVGGVALLAGLVGFAPAPAPVQSQSPVRLQGPTKLAPAAPATDTLTVRVIANDTGRPLAGAVVRSFFDFARHLSTTDEAGQTIVDYSAQRLERGALFLDVWAEEYVQQRHDFAADDPKYASIPKEYTIRLLPGTETFGGTVKNEQGQPVANANVDLWGYFQQKAEPHELCWLVRVTTDAEGRWRSGSVRPMKWINVYVSHPDYVYDASLDSKTYREDGGDGLPFDTLEDFTSAQTLTRGVGISGRVVDDGGRGVSGATVRLADGFGGVRLNERRIDYALTGRDGRFELRVRPGEVVLLAQAAGLAPAVRPIATDSVAMPLELRMGLAKVFLGRVTDEAGRPLANVQFQVSRYREVPGLFHTVETGADGRFRWDSAPPDGFRAFLTKKGKKALELSLTPTESEQVFVLQEDVASERNSLRINAAIKDARTGERIKVRPEIERGTIDPRTGEATWLPVEHGASEALLDCDYGVEGKTYRFRISAVGYRTLETRDIRDDEGEPMLELALEPDPRTGPSGRVVDPEERPVPEAKIVIATREYSNRLVRRGPDPAMYDNRLPPIPLVTTDGEGRYTLPWLGVPFELAAVHASGFARRSSEQIEATTEIRLARWSRVEGEVRNGNKAAAQSLVMMSSDEPRPPAVWGRDAVDRYGLPARIGAPHFMIDLKTIEVEATTDDAGRFSFERVPPEDMVLRHSVGSQFAHEGLLRVLPGETARITLGGQGRPVTGRVVAPARAKRSIDLAEVSLRGRGPSIQAQPYMPPIPEGLTREGRSDWVERWWHSPEGRDFRAARSPRPVKLEPDGRFRAEDLAAGEYVLEAWFYQGGGTPVEAGFVGHSFTVPPISGGRSDEPLDLGEIPIRLSPLLPHGREIAASFVMLDAPEQRRSLAEYRGKYVVLVCTANWAEIDPVEREQLRELFVSGNKTEKVVVLGLSFDDTIEEARAAPARAATPWPQAYAGPWETGDVAEGLGLGSIPRIIVIDPQGRFLSRSLSIPVIRRLFSR